MVKVLLKLLLLITWKPTPECFFNEKFCTSIYICRLHSKEERHFSAFRRKIINDYLKRAFIKNLVFVLCKLGKKRHSEILFLIKFEGEEASNYRNLHAW